MSAGWVILGLVGVFLWGWNAAVEVYGKARPAIIALCVLGAVFSSFSVVS